MEIILNSGAKLVVTPAPFEDAHDLNAAILESMKGLSFSEKALEIDLNDMKSSADFFSQILDKIISIAISKNVKNALFKCFQRCSYDDVRVNANLFDDSKLGTKAREDYYMICFKVIEVNCWPFFLKTFSEFQKMLPKKDVPLK